MKGRRFIFIVITALFLLLSTCPVAGESKSGPQLILGLSDVDFRDGEFPSEWKLRQRLWGPTRKAQAKWVLEDQRPAVRLYSKGALTFLERRVDIDLREYPIVAWSWKVDNVLSGFDERTVAGDDHPIRIFFVLEPETAKQSLWFRLKRALYLDRWHGHPMGGRFTEYLWSSHLPAGEILFDPGKPWQKLMVIEGGEENLGQWLSYRRNLYDDFKRLYGEEPRRLVFIGILNDTDATGQEALSFITDLHFLKSPNALPEEGEP